MGLHDFSVYTGPAQGALTIRNQQDWKHVEGGTKIIMRTFGFRYDERIHCGRCDCFLGSGLGTYEWYVCSIYPLL